MHELQQAVNRKVETSFMFVTKLAQSFNLIMSCITSLGELICRDIIYNDRLLLNNHTVS